MKKFFSIFCALAVVLSASALPQVKAEKKVAYGEKVTSFQKQTVKTVAKAANTNKAEKSLKAFEPKAAKKSFNAAVAKAPKAKKEVINIVVSDGVKWVDNCASAGWWQIIGVDDVYGASISNMNRDEAAGSYAWEDLDPDYTFVQILETEENIYFTDGSCTVEIDEAGNVTVAGTFEGQDGNTYNISLSSIVPVVPAGGDFEAVSVTESFYSSDNDVWVRMTDADGNRFSFDVVVAEGLEELESGHEYTLEDMIANYSYATVAGTTINYAAASIIKTVAEDGSFEIKASFLDEESNLWNIHYAQGAPSVREMDLTLNGSVAVGSAYSQITAADADTTQFVSLLLWETDIVGEWSTSDFYASYTYVALKGDAGYLFYDMDEAALAITFNEEANEYHVLGTLLAVSEDDPTDFILFNLDLTIAGPQPVEPTRQEDLTIAGLKLSVFDGAWQLMGYNEDETKYVSIAAYSDVVGGEYTQDDLAADYCYVVTDIEGSNYNYFELAEADLNVIFNEEDSTILITGTFIGVNDDDVPLFNLHLSGRIPTPVVVDLTFEFAQDEAGISVIPSNDEDAWDWIIVDEATFEDYGADEIADIIYSNYGDMYAVQGTQLFAWDEEISWYTTDEETGEVIPGTYFLVVWGSGENNVTTPADSFEFKIAAQAINNTDAAVKAAKRIVNGTIVIEKNGVKYNVLGTELK